MRVLPWLAKISFAAFVVALLVGLAAALGTRFGFLTAPRSTVIQPGPVHGGITTDPDSVLESLMQALVLG